MARKIGKHDGRDLFESTLPSGVVKGVDTEGRLLRIRATDETKDRDGDKISFKGWDLKNYRKNPVFLWAHDYTSVPIGAAKKIVLDRTEKAMYMVHRFPTKGVFPFADMILQLYSEKIINAGSVGFLPYEWDKLEEDEEEKKTPGRFHFKKQELLEHSGCAVPANPSAVQDAVKSFGFEYDFEKNLFLMPDREKIEVDDKTKDNVINELGKYMEDGPEVEEKSDKVQVQVPVEFVGEEEEKSLDVIGDEELKEITFDEVMKPYKNEHACRLKEPGQYSRFARKNCEQKVDGKCVDVIYGIKNDKAEIQALRFPKSSWSAADARSVCNKRGGKFEAAATESVEISLCNAESIFFIDIKGDLYEYSFDKECFEITEEDIKAFVDLFESVLESLAGKSLKEEIEEYRQQFYNGLAKIGAVLNRKNKARLKQAGELIQEVLAEATEEDDGEEKQVEVESTSVGAQSAEGETMSDNDNEAKSLYGTVLFDDDVPLRSVVNPPVKARAVKRRLPRKQLAEVASVVTNLSEMLQKQIKNKEK